MTVGIGHLIPNRQSVSSITMHTLKNGQPAILATFKDKQVEYDAIVKKPRGYKAEWYKKYTALVMKDSDITVLLNKHVSSFYKELSAHYTKSKGYPENFDQLDKDVQAALFDMIFNLGLAKLTKQFAKFDGAVKIGDWKKAAAESNRPQLNAQRNAYVKNKFLASANRINKKATVQP